MGIIFVVVHCGLCHIGEHTACCCSFQFFLDFAITNRATGNNHVCLSSSPCTVVALGYGASSQRAGLKDVTVIDFV